MNRTLVVSSVIVVLLLGVAGGGYYLWRSKTARPAAVATAAAEPVPATPAPPADPPIHHPIESMPTLPPGDAAPGGASDDGVKASLDDLLGSRAVLSFLQVDNFIGRIVATVDNLDREHATPRLWPTNPMAGRFSASRGDGSEVIAPDNPRRYKAFVDFVEAIDTPRAVALYVKLYPRFQQAYAALGYPRLYFNDRLVEVIDRLIAAPVPHGPVAVRLLAVKGPVASAQPWTRYEFVDPALEALPAGQKMMVRVGPDNELRLKAKLLEFRRGLATGMR